MKVRAGRLTDKDRALIFESNRTGHRVLIATTHEPLQAVGTVTDWTYDAVQVGGWSFETSIPWESIVAVWWRDEAPDESEVARLIADHMDGSGIDGGTP